MIPTKDHHEQAEREILAELGWNPHDEKLAPLWSGGAYSFVAQATDKAIAERAKTLTLLSPPTVQEIIHAASVLSDPILQAEAKVILRAQLYTEQKLAALSQENAAHKSRLLELVREAKQAVCYESPDGEAHLLLTTSDLKRANLNRQWDALNKLQEEIEKI